MEEQLSFIKARDPSINPYFLNRYGLKNARRNICPLLVEECENEPESEQYKTQDEEEYSCMQVFLRVKESKNKSEDYIIKDNTLLCKVPQTHPTKERIYKKYSFTEIFGPNSKQTDIFDSIVRIRLLHFINGKKSSLFTYGASGGGKTFTIVGTAEEPGLIPRVLEYLFRSLEKLPKLNTVKPTPDCNIIRLDPDQQEAEKNKINKILESLKAADSVQHMKTYRGMEKRLSSGNAAELEISEQVSVGIWVSFAEIYNEEIFDLLLPRAIRNNHQSKLSIGFTDGNAYIKNLSHINVSSGLEAYQVFQYGLQKLKYAETNVNSHSSRSHSIFSIKIVQTSDVSNTVYVSSFNFCDLAGAERSKKTMNSGTRLKESNSINKSLLALDRCIRTIKESQKRPGTNQLIPFRESKLTQIFQKALLGFENLCMIVNICDSKEMLNARLNVLNFSALTKSVIESRNEIEITERKCLQDEVGRLEQILEDAKTKLKELKEQRKYNFEMEKQRLIDGSNEIMEDLRKFYENKEKALRLSKEREYQTKLKQLQSRKKEQETRKRRRIEQQQQEDIEIVKAKCNELNILKNALHQRIKNLENEKNAALVEQERLMKRYNDLEC